MLPFLLIFPLFPLFCTVYPDKLIRWTLIVDLQGALGPGNSYLETRWQMSQKIVALRHWFPGNCSHSCTLSPSSSVFSLHLSFYPWPPYTTLASYSPWSSVSVHRSFTPTQCRRAVKRCIDLAQASQHYLTRKSKDTTHISHVISSTSNFVVKL